MRVRLALATLGAAALVSTAQAYAADSDAADLVPPAGMAGIVAAADGTAGVPQAITVVAPRLANRTVVVSALLGSRMDSVDVRLNARGQGNASWTPQTAGEWTLGVPDQTNVRVAKPTIAAVPTVLQLLLPNRAERFEPLQLLATVEATAGEAVVDGTVEVFDVERGKVGSADVTSLPHQRASARIEWVPPDAGTYAFYAHFVPKADPGTGSAAVQPSHSPASYLTVTSEPVRVSLRMPAVLRVGQPALVQVDVNPIFRGSVTFRVDGRTIADDVDPIAGVAATIWTPSSPGLTTVEVELQSAVLPRLQRSVLQGVDVQPPLPRNPMSVSPVIQGGIGEPWADDSVLAVPGGTRIDLVMSTGNGAGVNLRQRGSCLISGASIYLPKSGGGCLITFSAPGDARYSENTATVVLSAHAAPAQKSGAQSR